MQTREASYKDVYDRKSILMTPDQLSELVRDDVLRGRLAKLMALFGAFATRR